MSRTRRSPGSENPAIAMPASWGRVMYPGEFESDSRPNPGFKANPGFSPGELKDNEIETEDAEDADRG